VDDSETCQGQEGVRKNGVEPRFPDSYRTGQRRGFPWPTRLAVLDLAAQHAGDLRFKAAVAENQAGIGLGPQLFE